MTLAEKINAALDAGKTIQVTTYLKAKRVKAKHRAMLDAEGFQFFKTDSKGGTVMVDGWSKGQPRYVCIDGAKITAH